MTGHLQEKFAGYGRRLLRRSVSVSKRVLDALVEPLRTSDEEKTFRLPTRETATTTYDGDVGWNKRPPAIVECPQCGSDILQHNARDSIDCPRCTAEFEYGAFEELELRQLNCPVCKGRMQHGQRHPEVFDFPEWATCDNCRYHWEFRHSYS
ncbi:MAG: hypothetical protein ABEH77_05310 [Halobacteriaceae archaeon]